MAAPIRIPAAAMTDGKEGVGRSSGPASTFKWRALKEDRELRLDRAVSAHLLIPLEEAALLIDFGSVYVQGRIECAPARNLAEGEEISVNLPPYGVRKFYEVDPARIFFRDRFLLAYDRKPGPPASRRPMTHTTISLPVSSGISKGKNTRIRMRPSITGSTGKQAE